MIGDAQQRLPGVRPCGFHSPYGAAAWPVLAQRLRIVQAARLRAELIARHGEDGAFPPPHTLRGLDPDEAVQRVQQVKGLGPFAAGLVMVRGANAPTPLPRHERRQDAEISERYGPGHTLAEVSEAWRPYRTWAARTRSVAMP